MYIGAIKPAIVHMYPLLFCWSV